MCSYRNIRAARSCPVTRGGQAGHWPSSAVNFLDGCESKLIRWNFGWIQWWSCVRYRRMASGQGRRRLHNHRLSMTPCRWATTGRCEGQLFLQKPRENTHYYKYLRYIIAEGCTFLAKIVFDGFQNWFFTSFFMVFKKPPFENHANHPKTTIKSIFRKSVPTFCH